MPSAGRERFGELRVKLLVLLAAALSLSCSFVRPTVETAQRPLMVAETAQR